jgi:hypothetical protein
VVAPIPLYSLDGTLWEHTSSVKTAFVRFITTFVAMIGFADTEHNSE